jgi:hypothetical protein
MVPQPYDCRGGSLKRLRWVLVEHAYEPLRIIQSGRQLLNDGLWQGGNAQPMSWPGGLQYFSQFGGELLRERSVLVVGCRG